MGGFQLKRIFPFLNLSQGASNGGILPYPWFPLYPCQLVSLKNRCRLLGGEVLFSCGSGCLNVDGTGGLVLTIASFCSQRTPIVGYLRSNGGGWLRALGFPRIP